MHVTAISFDSFVSILPFFFLNQTQLNGLHQRILLLCAALRVRVHFVCILELKFLDLLSSDCLILFLFRRDSRRTREVFNMHKLGHES